MRKKRELDYNKWYNNPAPDLRSREQIQYEKTRNRNIGIFVIGMSLIMTLAIIALR